MLMKWLQICILLISIYSYYHAPLNPNSTFLLGQFIVACILVASFYKSTTINDGTIIKHSTLFLISFIIIYYQYPLEYLLGNTDAISQTDMSYIGQYCKGVAISNIALSSFCIGYQRKRKQFITESKNYVIKSPSLVNVIAIISLLAFILTVDPKFVFRGYGIYDKGTLAEEFEKILQMSLIASFVMISVLHSGTRKFNDYIKIVKTPLLILILYVSILTLAGARYAVIRMLIVVFFSYYYITRPKLRTSVIIIGIIIVALAASLQGILRSDTSGTIADATHNLGSSASISPLTSELAFSVTTLHVALENVPSSVDYNYGLSFIPALLLLIPGARSLFFNMFNIPPELQNSGYFITLLGYGDMEKGAMGSSSIADVYISLGVIGVIVAFWLFGIIIRYLENRTYLFKSSIYIIAISCCFYSQMLYLNRESLFTVLFGLPYVLLFIWISPAVSSSPKTIV